MDKDKKDVNSEFSVPYYMPDESVAGSEPTSFHYESWLNFMNQVAPLSEAYVTVTAATSGPTKDEALAAYEKLDHTLCLNSSGFVKKRKDGTIVNGNIKFNQDKDYHVDCNDLDEMIHCLEVVKQFIESK